MEDLKVSGLEIKEAIQKNNAKIDKILSETDTAEIFELNPVIAQLVANNQALKRICGETIGHNFVHGYCEYCGESQI